MCSTAATATAVLEEDFDAVLNEFDGVMADFSCTGQYRQCQYQAHLDQVKRMSVSEDRHSVNSSPANSLNCSVEKLNSTATEMPKAKLGDTQDLEDFIANLDKTLEEMM
ncbi:regulator of cell cycle RGCC [Callorhinchus milii]|uniref:Chloride channel 5 n=1 Tax=Callorhinchus milii TaxID=7868 RepID=V9LGH5_CALMI|nr:regulator of cell cycle RGCC [Callorhinchus milii]